jgi:hypothetical protein
MSSFNLSNGSLHGAGAEEIIINFSECTLRDRTDAAVKTMIAHFCSMKSTMLDENTDLNKLYHRSLKRKFGDKKVPPGSSLVRRLINDTRYLLSVLCIDIGKCFEMLNGTEPLLEAIKYFRESLMWFPSSVEGGYLLGKHLRHRVANEAELTDVEEIWSKAVSSLVTMGYPIPIPVAVTNTDTTPSPHESSMNALILHREKQAGKCVMEALTLHHCQQGHMHLALPLLLAEKYTYKLSQYILNYDINPSNKPSACHGAPSQAMGLDSYLPTALLRQLQHVFRPSAPYWSEHDYDFYNNASRKAGYFSYLYPFREQSGPMNVLEQTIDRVFATVATRFPEVTAEATIGNINTLNTLSMNYQYVLCVTCVIAIELYCSVIDMLMIEWWVQLNGGCTPGLIHAGTNSTSTRMKRLSAQAKWLSIR